MDTKGLLPWLPLYHVPLQALRNWAKQKKTGFSMLQVNIVQDVICSLLTSRKSKTERSLLERAADF
jgi:hypothetical protein